MTVFWNPLFYSMADETEKLTYFSNFFYNKVYSFTFLGINFRQWWLLFPDTVYEDRVVGMLCKSSVCMTTFYHWPKAEFVYDLIK